MSAKKRQGSMTVVEKPGIKDLLKIIRKDISNRRKALSREEIQKLSQEIILRFLGSSIFKTWTPRQDANSPCVGLYSSMNGEPQLVQLDLELRKLGFQPCYPRIGNPTDLEAELDSRQMSFVKIGPPPEGNTSAGQNDWTTGPYGVQEPVPGLPEVPKKDLLAVFVPGVAFGLKGERVGRGKGYYDRFLAQVPGALKVSFAFDFQVFPSLPQQVWDQPVHWIITEKREIQATGFVEGIRCFSEVLKGSKKK